MIADIKDRLRGNKELILEVLNEFNLENLNPNMGEEIRWGGKGGSKLNIESLYYTSFSHNKQGDIITLYSYLKGVSTGQAIKELGDKLNIKYNYNKVEVELPFGGFFKKFIKNDFEDDKPLKTYEDSIYNQYLNGSSLLFIRDGISALTQEAFNIGYDIVSNRITIPWYNEMGQLVGVMGRLNKEDISETESRYMPVIPFAKGKALYGFNFNYKGILDTGTIIVVESEKSVLKAHQYGFHNVVAIGTSYISEYQRRLIKSTYSKIILCFDEGLAIKDILEEAVALKVENCFFENEVLVMDMTGMPTKSCIFDLDKETVDKAFREGLINI